MADLKHDNGHYLSVYDIEDAIVSDPNSEGIVPSCELSATGRKGILWKIFNDADYTSQCILR